MKKTLVLTLTLILFSLVIEVPSSSAQKQGKSWKDWSKKEAEQMLTNSPWSHMQVDTDTSEMFYQPTADPRTSGSQAPNSDGRLQNGASNQSTNLKYGIRFFSARPVRQAFVRMIQLQKKLEPDVMERLNRYAEFESTDSIIVAVTVEGTDKRSLGAVMQVVNSSTTGTLKNSTYLERKDGKRLFLEKYTPPGPDGFGARFIFPRKVDEIDFLTQEAGEVRFVSEFPSSIKLNVTFKLSDMTYNGAFEY